MQGELVRLYDCRRVAVVRHAPTADRHGRSRSCQSQREELSGEGEQQKKSGDQALHAMSVNRTPGVKRA